MSVRSRSRLPFHWNSHDLSLRALSGQMGVFSRVGPGSSIDAQGRISHAVNGQERWIWIGGRPYLLLEMARTNLATHSEPTTAQLLSASNVANATGWERYGLSNGIAVGDNSLQRAAYTPVTLTVSTQYTISVFVEMDDGGVPVVGTSSSSGDFSMVLAASTVTTASRITRLARTNVYRIAATGSTGGSIAHNSFGVIKQLAQSARTFRVCGFQIEQTGRESSYIRTNGSAVQREADVLYWDFLRAPGPMTLYARFIELGTVQMANARVLQIGSSNGASTPRIYFVTISGAGRYAIGHDNGAGIVNSIPATGPAIGQRMELAANLHPNGAVQLFQSIDDVESGASLTAGHPIQAAWAGPTRLYAGSAGSASGFGLTALESIKVIPGVHSLAAARRYW